MMPRCHYRRCIRTGKIRLGVISTEDDGECWEEMMYLCEKHAKKIEKQLLTEIYRGVRK